MKRHLYQDSLFKMAQHSPVYLMTGVWNQSNVYSSEQVITSIDLPPLFAYSAQCVTM